MLNGNGNGFSHRWWSLVKGRLGSAGLDAASPYRRLALQLHYDLPRSEGTRSALVVTPESSLVSVQSSFALAMSLADELKRPVLLVDATVRSTEATRILGCTGECGLADFLAEPALRIGDLAFQTTNPRLSFLPAGRTAARDRPGPPEQLIALFEAASRDYDFVLLSGGSVLKESMALALAPLVGCVLLLARDNETALDDLDAAQHALEFCRARKVGLVLTTPLAGDSWAPST